MQINPAIIKKQFEKSFGTYNANALVQKIMAQKMISKLCEIQHNWDNILELGAGTGLLTDEIKKYLKFKNFYANDLVAKSEIYIKKIIPDVIFYCGNAKRIKPTKKMDLIISNAMFQWFKDFDEISILYKNMLNKDGILAFSSFSPENYKEIRDITGISLEYKTSNEIKNIFSKDYDILYYEEFENILKFNSPLEILAHMKNTGVNCLSKNNWTFKDVKEFCEKYSKKYPENSLTYSSIIFICKKK